MDVRWESQCLLSCWIFYPREHAMTYLVMLNSASFEFKSTSDTSFPFSRIIVYICVPKSSCLFIASCHSMYSSIGAKKCHFQQSTVIIHTPFSSLVYVCMRKGSCKGWLIILHIKNAAKFRIWIIFSKDSCNRCSLSYDENLAAICAIKSNFCKDIEPLNRPRRRDMRIFLLGDLGKAVGELVTAMTSDDTSKTNGQRAPPPAFK